MIFARLYEDSTGWNGEDFSGPTKLVPKLGSDGVCLIDGRFGRTRQIETTKKFIDRLNKFYGRYRIKAFRIFSGERFSEHNPLTGMIRVVP